MNLSETYFLFKVRIPLKNKRYIQYNGELGVLEYESNWFGQIYGGDHLGCLKNEHYEIIIKNVDRFDLKKEMALIRVAFSVGKKLFLAARENGLGILIKDWTLL